jgi:hypothetical protein
LKRPAFQFYPADWRNNAKLRRCSWAARGAWMDVLGLLHDSDEYGVLRWELREIARAVGCPLALLKELTSKGVLKGCDKGSCEAMIFTPRHAGRDGDPAILLASQPGPLWFSSRFIRDEYVRQKRGESTRFEASPMPLFGVVPKAVSGDGSSSSSSSSSPSTKKTNTPQPPKRGRGSSVEWKTFVENLKSSGERFLPDDDEIWSYAEQVGLTDDMLRLAHLKFNDRYQGRKKRYIDWRDIFRTSVKDGWMGLWYLNEGTGKVELTSKGRLAMQQFKSDPVLRAAA